MARPPAPIMRPPARAGGDRLAVADAATLAKAQAFLAADRDLPTVPVRMRYLVLSQPRTGGTFLCEALQRSGKAGLPFEYLNPMAISAFCKRLGIERTVPLPRLMQLLKQHRTGANGVFGLHLHLEQVSVPMQTTDRVMHWLRGFDRLIFLYRRDKLAQAVSLERSIQSAVWHRDAHEQGERLPESWDFNLGTVARHVANFVQQEAIIRAGLERFPNPWIELTYEELDRGFETAWDRIASFLEIGDVPAAGVYPSLARMRDAASDAMVERFLAGIRDSDLLRDPAFRTIAAASQRRAG